MKFSSVVSTALLGSLAAAASQPRDKLQDDAAKLTAIMLKANDWLLGNLTASQAAKTGSGTCTPSNIAIRREFGSLSTDERKAYTDAVLCLQRKGPLTPAALAPGARSRFDDFVVTHINQTLTIHWTGTFLAWHRYFVWTYEQALRNECGYTGYQPYWDWPKYADAPQDSPIFNGDAYSMSGNGEYEDFPPYVLGEGTPQVTSFPRGLGGGCVTTGPFKDMVVNLGPVMQPNQTAPGPMNGLGYNPRCLTRDIGPLVPRRHTNFTSVAHLIFGNNEVGAFQTEMQGPVGSGEFGVHGGGHFTISGDPGADMFTATGDPAFWIHHAQIDRMWTIWQALDAPNRRNAINGTKTYMNMPPSDPATLDTQIEFGYAGGQSRRMRDLMSTTAGPFCYIYV